MRRFLMVYQDADKLPKVLQFEDLDKLAVFLYEDALEDSKWNPIKPPIYHAMDNACMDSILYEILPNEAGEHKLVNVYQYERQEKDGKVWYSYTYS